MVGCPGCGSKLVFDIASQKMKCGYCGQFYPVMQVSKQAKRADEHIEPLGQDPNADDSIMMTDADMAMEVTVFTCSQCGAEIVADADEAVTWCSYCGSPATLASRLTRIRKPDNVIPFKITKEDCIKRYRELAKKQIYAPSAMLSKGGADSFRGIYMPFWTYGFQREGVYRFPGHTVKTVGNQRITTDYMLSGRLQSNYDGLTHDASLSFDDEVSEHIVPFRQGDRIPFDECYLNGFYANAADQNDEEYRRKVMGDEAELIFHEAEMLYPDAGLKKNEAKAQLSDVKRFDIKTKTALDMYPVWFLSYKHGDRVSYGTVNGQTGKVFADFPASPYKYLAFSLLSAVPLFLLLNLFLTASPSFVMLLSLVAAVVASGMHKREIVELFHRQCRVSYDKKKINWKGILSGIGTALIFLIAIIFQGALPLVIGIISGLSGAGLFSGRLLYVLLGLGATVLFTIRFFVMRSRYMALSGVHYNITNALYIVVGVAATVMFILNPAADWTFYTVAYVMAGVVAVSVIGLIKGYNILSSVKPKQFNRSGGDDNA